ncbi:hypothetical protein SVIOM342S_08891 [Streptomyces violaceorubidus]
MKTSWRSASLVAGAVALLALTTACGQDGGGAAGSENVGATAAAPGDVGDLGAGDGLGTGAGAGQASASAPEPAGKLSVSANPEIGELVTDGAGRTLYRFDADTAQPPKTTCENDCATMWPPVAADDALVGEGIDKDLLGEVTRPDGTKQLTIGGWPAYRYAKDTAAGDVKGQGVGKKWYALAAGKKATAEPAAGLPPARARASASACATWISTASRPSTTASATRRATGCWWRSRTASRPAPPRPARWWPGSAATSSWR